MMRSMDHMGDAVEDATEEDSWMGTGILSVRRLLERGLRIPDYQRPYKWTVANVAQLIDDIDTFRRYDRYRIGTVILHAKDGRLEIVDGQQRFVTFCLIAQILARSPRLEGRRVPQVDPEIPAVGLDVSRANILDNFAFLEDTLARREDLKDWAESFLDHCEVVILTLSHVDEAFQMFDSQNTRGKALYPTDLLKAFHIREMSPEHTTVNERTGDGEDVGGDPTGVDRRAVHGLSVQDQAVVQQPARAESRASTRSTSACSRASASPIRGTPRTAGPCLSCTRRTTPMTSATRTQR